MPTKTWKSVEKKVALKLGGRRIQGNRGSNVEDVEHDIFSVEVKHGKSIPKFVTGAFEQARRNAPLGKIPLLVLHAENSTEYLAVLPVEVLAALLNGGVHERA